MRIYCSIYTVCSLSPSSPPFAASRPGSFAASPIECRNVLSFVLQQAHVRAVPPSLALHTRFQQSRGTPGCIPALVTAILHAWAGCAPSLLGRHSLSAADGRGKMKEKLCTPQYSTHLTHASLHHYTPKTQRGTTTAPMASTTNAGTPAPTPPPTPVAARGSSWDRTLPTPVRLVGEEAGRGHPACEHLNEGRGGEGGYSET